jgi:hypothetical protein
MTDEPLQPLPEPLQPSPEPIQPALESKPENVPPPPKKSRRKIWLYVAIGLGSICLLCAIISYVIYTTVMAEKAPIELVLNAYMKSMDAKDAQGAFAQFSTRTKRTLQISQLQDMLLNYYGVFESYQSLSVENIRISHPFNTNPNLPQGTVAEVSGTTIYKDNIQGDFTATLEKENGQWLIATIKNNVPMSKIK